MSAAGGNGATSRPSTRQHPLGIFATPTQQTPSPATAPRGRTLRRNRPGLTVRVPDAAPAAAPEAARDGESLGKLVVNGKEYTIRDGTASDFTRYGHLGAGAFGDVYKELHVPSETVMAVKEMRDAIQPEERQRLLRDITIIREAKDSEFIVDYYGARCAQGMVMVYMELMEASLDLMYESLRDRQLRLPNHVLVYITITVLKGMLYLKQKLHVLHRDIKPSNILLGSNGEIKLCDFGMSKVMEQSVLHSQVGCERYLAPERLDPSLVGRAYGTESDVWSFGISIVELGHLKFPYVYERAFELFTKVVKGDPPSLPRDLYEDDLCDFVNACLIKERELRPQLLRPAMEDATQLALADNAFFVANKGKDFSEARKWLVDNVVGFLHGRNRTSAASK
eukprot:m.273032 g.273032  ORF g.273032 m.273032 type:complete len:395 (-) comp19750_c2_seq29:949-2133(-)